MTFFQRYRAHIAQMSPWILPMILIGGIVSTIQKLGYLIGDAQAIPSQALIGAFALMSLIKLIGLGVVFRARENAHRIRCFLGLALCLGMGVTAFTPSEHLSLILIPLSGLAAAVLSSLIPENTRALSHYASRARVDLKPIYALFSLTAIGISSVLMLGIGVILDLSFAFAAVTITALTLITLASLARIQSSQDLQCDEVLRQAGSAPIVNKASLMSVVYMGLTPVIRFIILPVTFLEIVRHIGLAQGVFTLAATLMSLITLMVFVLRPNPGQSGEGLCNAQKALFVDFAVKLLMLSLFTGALFADNVWLFMAVLVGFIGHEVTGKTYEVYFVHDLKYCLGEELHSTMRRCVLVSVLSSSVIFTLIWLLMNALSLTGAGWVVTVIAGAFLVPVRYPQLSLSRVAAALRGGVRFLSKSVGSSRHSTGSSQRL